MQRILPRMTLSLGCAVMLLSGCASVIDSHTPRSIDEAKVQAIERAARANGVTVRWVNYPLK